MPSGRAPRTHKRAITDSVLSRKGAVSGEHNSRLQVQKTGRNGAHVLHLIAAASTTHNRAQSDPKGAGMGHLSEVAEPAIFDGFMPLQAIDFIGVYPSPTRR